MLRVFGLFVLKSSQLLLKVLTIIKKKKGTEGNGVNEKLDPGSKQNVTWLEVKDKKKEG